jgi:hypothetical protein
MPKKLFLLIIFTLSIPETFRLYAQGCSDAGVCSFGTHVMDSSEEAKGSSIGIRSGLGIGDGATIVSTVALTADLQLIEGISFTALLPFVNAIGNDFGAGGIGDPFAGLNIDLYDGENDALSLMVGGRFALGATDMEDSGTDLPMVYQPGLGTNDLLARITYTIDEWSFALGYQQPFGTNENSYSIGDLGIDEEEDKFWPSNQLERGADLSFRIDYAILSEETVYRFGLLPIYRLQESSISVTDNNIDPLPGISAEGRRIDVDGSSGLTLNITGGLATKLSEDWVFTTDLGFPVLVRQSRPDGTTRAFQLNAGFDFLF